MTTVHARKRQGCLTALLSMFSDQGSGITRIDTDRLDSGTSEATGQPSSTPVDWKEDLPYRLQFSLLTQAESRFYEALKSITQQRAEILCKVRLGDVFFTPNYYKNVAYANRINQKHVDFLICELKTMKPMLGIELDDSSHYRSRRRERDQFVDDVFETTGLPLLHIQSQQSYDLHQLVEQIVTALEKAPKLKV